MNGVILISLLRSNKHEINIKTTRTDIMGIHDLKQRKRQELQLLQKEVCVSYVHVSLTAEMPGKLKPEIIAILRDAGVVIDEGNS